MCGPLVAAARGWDLDRFRLHGALPALILWDLCHLNWSPLLREIWVASRYVRRWSPLLCGTLITFDT